MWTVRLLLVPLFALVCLVGFAFADEKEKDKPKDKKKGTVVGEVTAKGPNWIEVKADGEEKGRRYVPHWRGGAPAAGGGPDKKMLETFSSLKIGTRIRMDWVFEERARAEKIEVVKAVKEKEKDKDEK